MGLHDENAAVTQVHFLPHQVSQKSQQLFCFENSTFKERNKKLPVPFFGFFNGFIMQNI